MAEFVVVMKHKARMCEANKFACLYCGLSSHKNGYDLCCPDFMKKHPQEAEEIIMKWAEENPVITNRDKFKEVFGDGICLSQGMAFWESEYKPPKGE